MNNTYISIYADLSNIRADIEKYMPRRVSRPMCWCIDRIRKYIAKRVMMW